MNNIDLVVILRRASEFLELKDTLSLLCLNHYFLRHLPNQEFYAYLSVSIAKIIADINADITEVKTKLSIFLECQSFKSCEDLFNCIKDSSNLIKNPCGKERFNHWEVIDGGDGWSIEQWGCFKANDTVFVSSYQWCALKQRLNIPKSNKKRFLLVGAYIGEIQSYSQMVPTVGFANPSDSFGDLYPYRHFNLRTNIKPSKKYAVVSFNGKDTKCWAGHYGARFGYCYARIFYEE